VLVLLPSTIGIGAALALGVIAGALVSHLTVLGIEVKGDGGTLFYLALLVFMGSAWLAWKRRTEIPLIKNLFK